MVEKERLFAEHPILARVAAGEALVWINEDMASVAKAKEQIALTMADIDDAEARLARFAPFLMARFPETVPQGGLIESALVPVPRLQAALTAQYGCEIPGRLLLKQDSHLAIAGSVGRPASWAG